MSNLEQLVSTIFHTLFTKKDKIVDQSPLEDELGKLPPKTRALVEKMEAKDILQESAAYSRFKEENRSRRAAVLRHIRPQTIDRKRDKTVYLLRRLAAACVIIALGLLGYLLLPQFIHPDKTDDQTKEIVHNIQPGSSRATLTLSDGHSIQLDSVPGGIVMDQGLHYADGRSLDLSTAQSPRTMVTLQTPRGGEYRLTLADGSRIHMNADTKVIYPMAFDGNTREVTLYGEAFFEIAPDKEKPFHVHTNNNEVVVLGTEFNIRSYQEESLSYVTLVTGKVRLKDGQTDSELTPGMQAVSDGQTTRVRNVNVEDFVSWKDGLFVFYNENIEDVAAKISRWYDIDIEIAPSAKNLRIWGSLSKYDTFDKILEVLQLIDNELIINIEGRRVYIKK